MTSQLPDSSPNSIKVKLLTHLAQELLTPLTSVIGMASVLGQEIYGPLTNKQKEYLDIIQNSSRQLRSLVEEILGLAELDDRASALKRTTVDIETLCQQVVSGLSKVAARREQEISLSVGPGHRIWLLDKEKVQQMLHHLMCSVIQSADAGSILRMHLGRREQAISIAVWVFHPWLGDSLPHAKLYSDYLLKGNSLWGNSSLGEAANEVPSSQSVGRLTLSFSELATLVGAEQSDPASEFAGYGARERLGLLLSCQLLEVQGGQFSIQGSPEAGYRYVLTLPSFHAGGLLES